VNSPRAVAPVADADTTFLPSPQVPVGGLAAHGLGESYVVDTASGALTLTVALALTPGRGAASAPLSLTWSSGGGRSPVGLGWALAVPSVTRGGGPRLPTYTDADAFSLVGAGELVPALEPGPGGWMMVEHEEQIDGVPHVVRRFRPRADDTRTRVERCTPASGGVPFWRTTEGDNIVRTFGRTASSRVSDPSDVARVHEWLLDEVRDDRGDVAVYAWKPEDSASVVPGPGESHRLAPGAPAQPGRYLKSVRYANAVPGDGMSGRLLVVLDYGEHDLTPDEDAVWPARPDAYSTYRPGFEVRTWRRLRRVLMFHDFGPDLGDGPSPRLVRAVELEHDDASRVVRLRQVGFRWGQGAYNTAALPPLDLGYSDPVLAIQLRSVPGSVSGATATSFVDLEGDGMPGLLTATPGGWWFERAAGDGTYEPGRVVPELPPSGGSGPDGLVDVDGSGRLACVSDSDALAGSSIRGPDGRWDRLRPVRGRAAAAKARATGTFDLDGDGLADRVSRAPEAVEWTQGRGRDGDGPTSRVLATASPDGPRPPGTDQQSRWFDADMTGDGLTDLVHVGPALVEYWPSLGWGRYGGRIMMSGTPRFDDPAHFDARRLRFADLDGTGTADVIYLNDRDITVWRNRQGTAWVAPEALAHAPRADSLDDVALRDLLGTGTPCLVWTSSAPGRPRIRFLELAAQGRAHLLTSVVNNLGKRTLVRYETSAQQAARARREGAPWASPPAGAAVVVGRIEEHDDVAETAHATRYEYRDPWTDPDEREARGFAFAQTVEVPLLDTAGPLDHPAVRHRQWYRLGRPGERLLGTWDGDHDAVVPDDHDIVGVVSAVEHAQAERALAGRQVRTETWVDDRGPDVPVLVTQTRLRVRLLQPAVGEVPAAYRVEPLEVLEAAHERAADDPRVTHELTLAVDEHGTAVSEVRLAYPRRVPQVPEQRVVLAGWTRTSTASLDTPGVFRASVPVEVREDELSGLAVPAGGRFTPDGLVAQLAAVPEIDPAEAPTSGLAQRQLRTRTRYEYWDDAHAGPLPVGQVGARALVRRVLRLAMTDQVVSDVLGTIAPAGLLSGEGGYEHAEGAWWSTDGVRRYDPATFFQPSAHTTPFGNTAEVGYDPHGLQVTEVRASTTAPLSLVTSTFEPDYTALAVRATTDPNGVTRSVAFDPLDRVTATWRTGDGGSGDPPGLPGTQHLYGSDEWHLGLGPAWSQTATRATHGDAASAWHVQRVYVDGSGRIALTKTAAEPGEAWQDDGAGGVVLVDTTPEPRWIGTGRTVFDGAGRPVEQYEPYFATGPEHDTADALVKHAELQRRTYDALGRLVRVDHPDGTFETVEIGPWQQVDSDRNDTVLASAWFAQRQAGVAAAEQRSAALAAGHADTPLVRVCDGLGRFVRVRVDNGADGVQETRFVLDLAGEGRSVIDARGIEVGAQLRDGAGRIIRSVSPDSGTQLALPDAAGRHLRVLGADGRLVSVSYDLLGRPTATRVRDDPAGPDRVAELVVYGEGHPQAAARGLIGQAHRRYDGAGVAVAEEYDLLGNLVAGTRRVLSGTAEPDWSPAVGVAIPALDAATAALLDPAELPATSEMDALGRPLLQTLPDGTRIELVYDGAGPVTSVGVRTPGAAASTAVVVAAEYDARRRRVSVTYGNGVVATHEFDTGSGRPVRLAARSGATTLQDLTYTWDPVGNVVEVADDVAPVVFFAGAVAPAGARYTYDPAYRLRTATGREHASLGAQPDRAEPAVRPVPHPNEAGALRPYTETYTYDDVGNLLALAHASTALSWTRRYTYQAGTDRLAAHQSPGDADAGPFSATFDHDAAGRMTRMPHLAALGWDHAGRLVSTDLGGGGTVTMHYDGTGRRVRKVWQHGAVREERLYVGAFEVYRRFVADVLERERRTVRVEGGGRTVALVETLVVDTTQANPDLVPRIRYQIADLVGSSTVECDDAGAVISFEEYHPFGSTSLWLARGRAAASAKRYRYAGKEKDQETGFSVIGARYYAPWLGRWVSPDPAGLSGGTNRYAYCGDNPVSTVDPSGLGDEPSGLQMWFSEAKALWIEARATQTGRGFLESTATKVGHRDFLKALVDLWGGPEEWDIGHKEEPFAVQRPGTVSKVGVEDAGYNRSKGATADKALKAEAKAAGETVRDPKGRWPEPVKTSGKPPAVPQEIGGVPVKPPAAAGTVPAAPPSAAPVKAAPRYLPPGPAGEQLKLPGVQTEAQLNLFDQPAKPAAPATPPVAPGGPSPQLELFPEQATPRPPAAAGDVAADAAKAADLAQDATKGAEAAKDAATATDLATDASTATQTAGRAAKAADATADVAKAADVATDATKVAEVTKDAAAAKNVAPAVKKADTLVTLAKTATPAVKSVAPAAKEAGLLTRTVEGVVAVGSKVSQIAAPVVKVAAPVARVVGEVAKPLAVGVAAYDMATANNNSQRLVAAGDLSAGVAMYCGPVGEAYSVGYTVGGLADKGIEKASKAAFGVDLSPSNVMSHGLDLQDKLVSAVIPDDPSKPAYKNENKIAWFLIDTLGF